MGSARVYPSWGSYSEDAYHIAITVINEVDYLLSWNFKHIVRMVNTLNKQVHIARKIIAKEAQLEGLSFFEYVKLLGKRVKNVQ